MLADRDRRLVARVSCRQAARSLLSRQEQSVRAMLGEGLLAPTHAAALFELIRADAVRLDEDRRTDLRWGERVCVCVYVCGG